MLVFVIVACSVIGALSQDSYSAAEDRFEGAAPYLGLADFDSPEGPGPALKAACSLKDNAGDKWEAQAKDLNRLGQFYDTRKKRSVSAWEHFAGDQAAFDAFRHQFHHDDQGRKRSTRMNRYSKETVDGVTVETLKNWNEPVNLSQMPIASDPVLKVNGKDYTPKAANPSKQTTISDKPLHFCGLGLSASNCTIEGKPTPSEFACLVFRGETSFVVKVQSCIEAGAVSVVIANNKEEDLGASLGDGVDVPVVTVPQSIGEELQALFEADTGVQATIGVPPPTGSGMWYPLTNHKDQGSCGDCYLFAAMTSVNMWGNLLLWEQVEAKGSQFGPKDQMWLDTKTMTDCYQLMLNEEERPRKATLQVSFDLRSGQLSGTEDEEKELMRDILKQFASSKESTARPLSFLSDWAVSEIENDCGRGCYSVETYYSTFTRVTSSTHKAGDEVSSGFEANVNGKKYIIKSVKATKGGRVCGGGWHHKVLQQWYDEQQKSRLGKASKSVRFVTHDQTDENVVRRAKYARGPSQKLIDANKCPLNADSDETAPILYRFDPHFDEDESSINPPPREDGTLASYRPVYAPENARPGSASFADKVRSVKAAAEYGPVMIGIAVCNSMFNVGRSNSAKNAYVDEECSDSINHIVNVIGFHIEDLPEAGEGKSTQVDNKEWWERSAFLIQNTWASWGVGGQAWVRVDFTQKWSLAIVPLVHRPGSFKNPYLPSKRLEELRIGKSWRASNNEYITGQSYPEVSATRPFYISSPGLPEVAFESVTATLLLVGRSDLTTAPTKKPTRLVFSALFSSSKYFEENVADDVIEKASISEDDGSVVEDGNWVYWSSGDIDADWEPVEITTRSGDVVNTYQLVVKFDLTATKLSATKPSSFWQRVQLEVDGLTSSDVSSSHDLVLSDVHLTIDESLSSEFRSDSARPSAPGGEEPSAAAHTTIASMIVAAVAFFQLF